MEVAAISNFVNKQPFWIWCCYHKPLSDLLCEKRFPAPLRIPPSLSPSSSMSSLLCRFLFGIIADKFSQETWFEWQLQHAMAESCKNSGTGRYEKKPRRKVSACRRTHMVVAWSSPSLYETINYVVDFEASYAAVALSTSRDNDVAAADHDDELIFDLLSDRIFDLITRILKDIPTFVLQTYIRLYLCTDTSFFLLSFWHRWNCQSFDKS